MADTSYTIRLINRVKQTAKTIQGNLERITAKAEAATAAIDGIGLIAGSAAIAGIFKLGAELETTQLKFNTLTGSVEAGTKLFNELTDFANATPFSNQALNDNANTLLAFGEDANNVSKTLRVLGDIAAGDQEKLKSLTLAFAQSQSAGKLMGQDLLQMINAGFNPLQVISEQTGQSIGYLKDQMSKGAISSDMVRQAFEAATAEGGRFHDMTINMSKTMAGKWSTVMGKGKFLISEFGLSMKDIFVPFLDGITRAIEFVSKYRDIFFPVLTVLTTFTGSLLAIVGAIKLWIMVQKVINVLLTANPIGLIIAGIAALVTAIVILWNRSEQFRGVMLGVWEVMKGIGRAIGGLIGKIKSFDFSWKNIGETIKNFVIKRFKAMLEGIKGIGRAFKALFKGEFKEAAREAGRAALNLTIGDPDKIKRLGKKAADLYREGFSKGKTAEKIKNPMEGLMGAGAAGSLALSPELKKLQAEGVVSGSIKTFNININQVTGIGTLSATTVEESEGRIGDSVVMAITKALADIKNV